MNWTTTARERGIAGRVTITAAHVERGWSTRDHLIDDSPADQLVGRRFRCVADAMRAATRAEGRWSHAVRVTLRDRDGRLWDATTAPEVPGRRADRLVPARA